MIYDPQKHQYFHPSGEQIPSVSRILGMCPDEVWLHKWKADGNKYTSTAAADFGTKVHDYLFRTVNGEIITYDDGIGDRKIKKMVDFGYSIVKDYTPHTMEIPMIHGSLKFGGTADFIGTNKETGIKTILDYKTNGKTATEFQKLILKYEAQQSAYNLLSVQNTGFECEEGYILHLPCSNKLKVNLNRGCENFLTLLDAYHDEEKRYIIDAWNSGMSIDEISDAFQFTTQSVCDVLKTYSVFH